MPKTHISRSQFINAPMEQVFAKVAHMGEWQHWSPWLIMEPNAKVEVDADGKHYSWKGNRVGEGNMKVRSTNDKDSVTYDLEFLKPFKNKATVGMQLKPQGQGTEVIWTMDGSLPWFMFWMKNMMQTFVGMDYERGLRLLKDYAEDGEVHSKLNFIGVQEYPGCKYVSRTRECSLDEMPLLMKQDFEKLMPWAAAQGMDPRKGFSIYHKFDPIKNKCKYSACVAYTDTPKDLPSEYTLESHAATKIYSLEHVGPYEHLGNAWSTMQTIVRNKEIKPIKGYHPFETYGNSPMDTAPNELITRINFAIK